MRYAACLLIALLAADLSAQKIEVDDLVGRVRRGEAGDARMRRRIAAHIAADPQAEVAVDSLLAPGAGREAVETALWIRRIRGDDSAAPTYLFSAFDHPVWTVRAEAWLAAVGIEKVPASAIEKGLADPLAPVRCATLTYLGMRPATIERSLRPSIRALVDDPHPDAADAAAGLLAALEDPDVADFSTLLAAAGRRKLGRRQERMFLSASVFRLIDDRSFGAFLTDVDPELTRDLAFFPFLSAIARPIENRRAAELVRTFALAESAPFSPEAIAATERYFAELPDFEEFLATTVGGAPGAAVRALVENDDCALPRMAVRMRLARELLFGRAPWAALGDLFSAWPASVQGPFLKAVCGPLLSSRHPAADRFFRFWMSIAPNDALTFADEFDRVMEGDLSAFVAAARLDRGDRRFLGRILDDARIGRRSIASLLGFRRTKNAAWQEIAETALEGDGPETVKAAAVATILAGESIEPLRRYFFREYSPSSSPPPDDSFWAAAEALHARGDVGVEAALLEMLERPKETTEEQKILLALESRITPRIRLAARAILEKFAYAERDLPTLLRLGFDATDDAGRGSVVAGLLNALQRGRKSPQASVPILPFGRLNGFLFADVVGRARVDAATAGSALIALLDKKIAPAEPVIAALAESATKEGYAEVFLRSVRDVVERRRSSAPDDAEWAFIGYSARRGEAAAVGRVREIFAAVIEEIVATQRFGDAELNERFDAAVNALLESVDPAGVQTLFEAMLTVDIERGIRRLTSIGAGEETDDEDDYRALWLFVFGAVVGEGREAVEVGWSAAVKSVLEKGAFMPDLPEIVGQWLRTTSPRSFGELPIVALARIQTSLEPSRRRTRAFVDFRLARSLWATNDESAIELGDRLAASIGRAQFVLPKFFAPSERTAPELNALTTPEFDVLTSRERSIWRSLEIGTIDRRFAATLPIRYLSGDPGRWLAVLEGSGWFDEESLAPAIGLIVDRFADSPDVLRFAARRLAKEKQWMRLLFYVRGYFADVRALDDRAKFEIDYFEAVAQWNLGDRPAAEAILTRLLREHPDLDRETTGLFPGYEESTVMKAIFDRGR